MCEAVLPILGQLPGVACTREELEARLRAWFASLPGEARLATDSPYDFDLLLDALGENTPANLVKSALDLREQLGNHAFGEAVSKYHAQPGNHWHHALHDAHANRAGWKAWRRARKSF